MYQLELVFQLLVHLQFMYFQQVVPFQVVTTLSLHRDKVVNIVHADLTVRCHITKCLLRADFTFYILHICNVTTPSSSRLVITMATFDVR